MKNCLIILTFLLIHISTALAKTDKTLSSIDETKALSDAAMGDAVAGRYRAAFNRFRPYWPLSSKEIDSAVAKVETGMGNIQKRFGTPLGFSFIERKMTRDFIVRYIYVQKYQNALVRWSFTYYKPKSQWHVLGVSFDDDYEALLK